MIKINNDEYKNYKTDIFWGNYERTYNKVTKKGIAPSFQFNIKDKIFIGLELTFDKENFKLLNLQEKTNITDYLTDISYEDENGWCSIITEDNYNCTITKTNNNEYLLEFFIESIELNNTKITINTTLNLF